MTSGDRSGEFGAVSLPALRRIRDLWLDLEPLVERANYDDPIDPAELHVHLADGIGDADSARFDVQWSQFDMYAFHYTDSTGLNWRFDRHPNQHSPERHFHPPPDAATADAEASCIAVSEVSLVSRAVHVLWRRAYEVEDTDRLNTASNPP